MVFVFYPTPFRDERGTMSHVFQGCGSKKGRRKCFNVNSQHILLPLTISPFCAWLFFPVPKYEKDGIHIFGSFPPPKPFPSSLPFMCCPESSRLVDFEFLANGESLSIFRFVEREEEDAVNLGLFSSLPFFGHEFFGHVVVFIVWPPEFFSRDVLSSLFRCQFIKFFSVPLLGPKSSFELLICFARSAVRIFSGAGLSWLF